MSEVVVVVGAEKYKWNLSGLQTTTAWHGKLWPVAVRFSPASRSSPKLQIRVQGDGFEARYTWWMVFATLFVPALYLLPGWVRISKFNFETRHQIIRKIHPRISCEPWMSQKAEEDHPLHTL